MRFVDWVREKRKTMKYHEIAAMLGVHPSYLGHIKNGKFTISKKFAEKVEQASEGLCKKEEIVFEIVDPKEEWEDEDAVVAEEESNSAEESCSQDPIEKLRRALC